MAWVSGNSPSESQRAVRDVILTASAAGSTSWLTLSLDFFGACGPGSRPGQVSLGSLNSVGQCLSILAAFLFPANEGPRFVKGAVVNLAFQCLGLVLALSMTTYYRRENRRRDAAEGGRPPKGMRIENINTLYDRAIGFRYTV